MSEASVATSSALAKLVAELLISQAEPLGSICWLIYINAHILSISREPAELPANDLVQPQSHLILSGFFQ
jgi:hypothetical protein